MTIRLGVIGTGFARRVQLPALALVPGVRLTAIASGRRANADLVAREFAIPAVFDDGAALAGSADVDLVLVSSTPDSHERFTVAALEAGKHVLCEARMAMDAAEAREMLAASRAAPRLIAQLVPAPFDLASWRTIRRLVADGSLGELREVHATMLSDQSLDLDRPLHWRERVE